MLLGAPEYAGGWNELIQCLKNLESLDWDKLIIYIRKFENKALARRLAYIFENINTTSIPKHIKKQIINYSGTNIYYFDPTKKGIFEKKWNIIIPKTIQEALHA